MTADLIARLESAGAGSRELSTEVFRALEPWSNPERFYCACTGACLPDSPYYLGGCSAKPRLTTSLDAIVEVIGEKLPGWTTDVHMADASPCTYPVHWRVESVRFDDCTAGIYYQHPKIEERELGEGCGKTPALALCAALLRAIQEGADG